MACFFLHAEEEWVLVMRPGMLQHCGELEGVQRHNTVVV
jgi:hypothetical protein